LRPACPRQTAVRTRVHVCIDTADTGLATDLLRLFSNPLTGLVAEPPLERGPFNAMNAASIRSVLDARIQAAAAVACLVGPEAHRSTWVEWEIETALSRGRGIVGIRLREASLDFVPRPLIEAGAQIIDAHSGSVIAAIERAALLARTRPGNK
jgi:hypothetical protein